jgi:succinate-semialdehyde dehydrogenase/glutarate-semialdehyde dehydrogenase
MTEVDQAVEAPRERIAAEVIAAVPKRLLIGGEWVDGEAGEPIAVEDPARGEELCGIADGSAAQAAAAVAAAAAAQEEWARTPPRRRGEILERAHDLMVERREQLATLITLEMGKPLAEARAEVDYSAGFIRWFAEEAVRIDGRYMVEPNGNGRLLVLKQPVGVCILVTPWNFPLAMGARKVAPAIAAGCAMVVKPARQTPLATLALGAMLIEAGLPPGVLNVVTSSRSDVVVETMLRDPHAAKVSFTGSTEVGKHLVRLAADQLLRVSMELGGNAPFVVFEDADLEQAVDGAMVAKMRNMGQACTAANRMIVQERVAEEFSALLAARMEALSVGPGIEPDSEVGPLIDERAQADVGALLEDAERRGARVLVGGSRIEGPGHFFEPTLLTDVDPASELLRQEIFGPVAPVSTFGTEAEAVAMANDTEYGLVSYLYTDDLGRAVRCMEALKTGMVGLNQGLVSNPAAPFGGVKHSGYGREGGSEGIDEYLSTKYVAINAGEGGA